MSILDELAGGEMDLDSLRLGDLGIDISSLGWQLTEDGTAKEIVHENDRYSMNQEETEWMYRVLDSCRRIHATAMVRIYTCKKDASTWDYVGLFGVAALVTEADLRMACAHFIRVVDLDGFNPNSSIMLQQELYPGFIYNVENDFFHTFEMSKYIAGLSFANEEHAKIFHEKVKECCNISASDVVDEEVDSKEKTFKIVGDGAGWRTSDSLTAAVGRKYAAGGITDGTEVSWKKKADLPPELKMLLSKAGVDANPNQSSGENANDKSEKVIDLLQDPQLRRRATMDISSTGTTIGDGINLSWSKNKKALTDDNLPSRKPAATPPPITKKKSRFKVFGRK